jgi:hypothetical protein
LRALPVHFKVSICFWIHVDSTSVRT